MGALATRVVATNPCVRLQLSSALGVGAGAAITAPASPPTVVSDEVVTMQTRNKEEEEEVVVSERFWMWTVPGSTLEVRWVVI